MKLPRFQLKTLLALVAVSAIVLTILLQWVRLHSAWKSYEQTDAAWMAHYVLCEDVMRASEELMRVENAWAWFDRNQPARDHLSRLKTLLEKAEIRRQTTIFSTAEGMNRETSVIRAEIESFENAG